MWRDVKRVDTEDPDPRGWITLRIEFDHSDVACFYAQGLGPRCEVIEPAELRERVIANAMAVVRRNG